MKLVHVVGARPNSLKVALVLRAGQAVPLQVLVHTGQHYDPAMSDLFSGPRPPAPDENLGVGSDPCGADRAHHARVRAGPRPAPPDWVVVYGDVNSTVACALVAVKKGIRIAHVEAGLRSRDRAMPEEINRILTDQLADLLLTPSRDGNEPRGGGIPADRVAWSAT